MSLVGRLPFIHVAIPILDEGEFLFDTLECLENQSYSDFRAYLCVNQPDSWWDDPERTAICERNRQILVRLGSGIPFDNVVIDRSSKGSGWKGKRHGVGWARKTAMDACLQQSGPEDLIVSLDADTRFNEDYLLSVAMSFLQHPDAAALSVSYFHHLTADPQLNRAILRYEIYMRHYLLNLMRIGSPYAFLALGSAIALPVRSYRAIGGMTPRLSGEDFYFLQKLRKFGNVICWNDEKVYPQGRYSDRVFFGTGPALIKGAGGDWSSYPIYAEDLFNDIWETYERFSLLYSEDVDTPLSTFLSKTFREENPWLPLRKNARTVDKFIRSCHEKLDGLRILQYLKTMHQTSAGTDESRLQSYLMNNFPPWEIDSLGVNWKEFSFSGSPVGDLEKIRMFLVEKEDECRFITTLL